MDAIEKFNALWAQLEEWEWLPGAARWDHERGWFHPLEFFEDQVRFGIPL